MRVERGDGELRLTIPTREEPLLRWALERASFIDTPATEQERIASFCSRALEALDKAR